jgi:hypothetical protein
LFGLPLPPLANVLPCSESCLVFIVDHLAYRLPSTERGW